MEFKYYKPGQGTWARWSAGILLGLMVLFGAWSLYNFPDQAKTVNGEDVPTFWGKPLVSIGSGGNALTPGHVIAFLVFVAGCVGVYLLVVNGRRAADFLIDTESEMHKVSWPPRHEYLGSSLVVIISVLIIGFYVGAVDILLQVLLQKTRLL